MVLATSLLLQNPSLAQKLDNVEQFRNVHIDGVNIFLNVMNAIKEHPNQTTARLLEYFRDAPFHSYLEKLVSRTNLISQDTIEKYFLDTVAYVVNIQFEKRRLLLLEQSRQSSLKAEEKIELLDLLNAKVSDKLTIS